MTLKSLQAALPGNYHLEIAESTIAGNTAVSMESSTPFPTYAVGDKISVGGFADAVWDKEPLPGQVLKVVDVFHYTWEIKNSHIGHKVRIAVELVRI